MIDGNMDIAPSVDTPIEFSLNNEEDEFNYIDISACEEPKSSIEEVVTNSSKKTEIKRRGGSKKQSWVWQHMDLIVVINKDGEEAQYVVGGSTSNLIHHLYSIHGITDSQINITKTHLKAKNNFLVRSLLKLLIRENLLLNLVSKESFHEFVHNLDSAFAIPCEKTVKHLIHITYNNSTNLLKQQLETTSKTVCLTLDLWTARNQQGFLGITYSWIDENFKIHEALFTLTYLKYPHTAININNAIYNQIEY
ncbi:16407_t:CDS:2 [Cetraspora pellucida]|uniref:16407_t:CDS:1 n=1 Tax=Cetraspora pellucida TaxID=1433469 RepID=A0A9N9C012_9GLOM|nr:16407_t:CDS:2 [Cetraspora pellucida]